MNISFKNLHTNLNKCLRPLFFTASVVMLFSFRIKEVKISKRVSIMDTTIKAIRVQVFKISPEDTLIASKENSKTVVIKMDGAGGGNNGQKPLYVLDGEIISESIMKVIDPNKIEAINVLKGPSATSLYGDKGKDGVIMITTKKENSQTVFIKSGKLADATMISKNFDGSGNPIIIQTEGKKVVSSLNVNPALIFIDGEKKTKKEMEEISPDQIKSIDIIKGEAAIKAYGAEAKDGVIKITTKKKVNL